MNELYRSFLNIKIASALAEAKASKGLKHHGITGNLREILMRDIIRPFLPSDFGVSSGKIISAGNKISKQLDVILFNKSIVPPIIFEENLGIFPVESVSAVIEVKSTLNSTSLRTSHKSALELIGFDHLPGEFEMTNINKPKAYIDGSIKMLNYCLFAYKSNLKANGDEAERYDKIRGQEQPAIRIICVVGEYLWAIQEGSLQWMKFDKRQTYDEVAGFLSLLLNSYKMISKSKGEPRFGSYIF